jgi:hypothetical protein
MNAGEGDWGAELPDDPPSIDSPIATVSGFDLSRDMDAQVRARPTDDPVLREPLKTPYRRHHAMEYSAGAAGLLAVLNLMALFRTDARPALALIPMDVRTYVIAQLTAAALAAALALSVLWRRPIWTCVLIAGWSLGELIPPLPSYLYGHTRDMGLRTWLLVISAAAAALIGLRGARAERDAQEARRSKQTTQGDRPA